MCALREMTDIWRLQVYHKDICSLPFTAGSKRNEINIFARRFVKTDDYVNPAEPSRNNRRAVRTRVTGARAHYK